MKTTLLKSVWLLGFSLILCCGIYPLALWVIGQLFFPFQANGSLLMNAAKLPVASQLIAQPFTRPEYFHPRPSAANYNAEASSSSALAPSNSQLRQRIVQSLAALQKEGVDANRIPVPDDAVMTSASGLDPHISLENATRQLDRVAREWARQLKQDPENIRRRIADMLQENTIAPLDGMAGGSIVNVMRLNWMLSTRLQEK